MATFDEWMAEIQRHVRRISGASIYDLGDWTYRDSYDDGEDPLDVARDVLADNWFPFDDDD